MDLLIKEIDRYLERLFHINRSITGSGNRETLEILKEIAPLEVINYSSGNKVYDWIIPDEWNVDDAWIKAPNGDKLVDFRKNNIHLVGYSLPINKKMTFEELKPHLHVHPTISDAIPYRTSYYKKDWGFCLTWEQYKILSKINGELHVLIDTDFDNEGNLCIGELLIPGRSSKEILISTYICHPSLANDNLSGLLLSAFLARSLIKDNCNKYSYRFVWLPETIGAIVYCANNENIIKNIDHGLVVSTVGGPGEFGYKQSIDPNHRINNIIEQVFKENNLDYIKYPFDINGSDERQYSSQAFGLNVATITKDKYYEYDFYHSSKDNLLFVRPEYISQSLELYIQVLAKLDEEIYFENQIPNCEVMLGKHDLYPKLGGARLPNANKYEELDLIRWILLLSNGNKSLAEISHKLNVDVEVLFSISKKLESKKILVQK